ncbi:MAG: hypothetical protein PVF68_03620, partial [Acidobacteriota bacterium]
CPQVANPDQGPVGFPAVMPLDRVTLGWAGPVDYKLIRGPLDGRLASYPVSEESDGNGVSVSIDGDPASSYYLLRLQECGTWGSAARDAALP